MGELELRNTLKVHRAIRNLTQAELGDLAGVTRKSVNAIETGRMVPSVLLALKLARTLGVSVNDIVRTLKHILDFKGDATYAAARPGEVQKIYLDATKAGQVLGWKPEVTFEEGLRRTVAWYKGERVAGRR